MFLEVRFEFGAKEKDLRRNHRSRENCRIFVFSFDHFTKIPFIIFLSLLCISVFEVRCHRQIEMEELGKAEQNSLSITVYLLLSVNSLRIATAKKSLQFLMGK